MPQNIPHCRRSLGFRPNYATAPPASPNRKMPVQPPSMRGGESRAIRRQNSPPARSDVDAMNLLFLKSRDRAVDLGYPRWCAGRYAGIGVKERPLDRHITRHS
jgi:hypothetical protein